MTVQVSTGRVTTDQDAQNIAAAEKDVSAELHLVERTERAIQQQQDVLAAAQERLAAARARLAQLKGE